MRTSCARAVGLRLTAAVLLCCLVGCSKSGARSSDVLCGNKCSDYQSGHPLPTSPPPRTVRVAIGGDARDDVSNVTRWAFAEANRRGAKAFFFLGDLELTPAEDALFLPKLASLGRVPFYPLMGNHEVETLGRFRPSDPETRERVKKFKVRFVTAPGVVFAPVEDELAYSADLDGGIHLIAMDNVSRRAEGFGSEQLAWLEKDLQTAAAAHKTILVGMHKGLANNPVTKHAMDEDGHDAVQDSETALGLFSKYKVAMVVVSHSHMYAAYCQWPGKGVSTLPCPAADSAKGAAVEVRLTGGMGAPLVHGLAPSDGGFHHFLLVDVPAGENKGPLQVEVVKFPGRRIESEDDETEEVE